MKQEYNYTPSVPQLLQELKRDRHIREILVHHERLAARSSRFADPASPLPAGVKKLISSQGINRLYSHQARALDRIDAGRNIVVSTPTASGKTFIYNLPVLCSVASRPKSRALYLFPLKSLERDQLNTLRALGSPLFGGEEISAAIYDGDTPSSARRRIRDDPPNVLITNPDMIHVGFLPHHARWADFFRELRYVVVDELHAYRGIFGAHMASLLRRLRRVARFYGSDPQWIACSATIANPGELAETLMGVPFEVIDESGAPSRERHFLFVNPTGSPYVEAARLFGRIVKAGLKTIAFTKSRKITELVHSWVVDADPSLAGRVSSYRSGYLPDERREIERRLFSGDLVGVISTSALEMGIDIGELDVCILVGYPGSIINTWQRGGRVGRADRPSAVFLIAQPDALDQYFMKNPGDFFSRGFESAAVDPLNETIVRGHLACAASEIPIRQNDSDFGPTIHGGVISKLESEGTLLRSASGDAWFSAKRTPQREVDIRAVGEGYVIRDDEANRVIGTISEPRVFSECHEGAIYLHRAQSYLVQRLDRAEKKVFARPVEADYYTRVSGDKDTEILETEESRPVLNFVVRRGRLKITQTYTSYEKRRIIRQDLLSVHPLDLPPVIFETQGLWIEIEDAVQDVIRQRQLHFMGGIHAVEHAAISLLPLFTLCDRNDVGGICYPMHPQVGRAAVFIYDGVPGGVGITFKGYDVIEELLGATLDLIRHCACEIGCPSCIHSPKCGSGNKPLDKRAADETLARLLGKPASPLPLSREEHGDEEDPKHAAARVRGTARAFRRSPAPPDVLFFDLETQRSAEEVGGWQNTHLMRLAVGVTCNLAGERFEVYREDEVRRLIDALHAADLVIGFNLLRFDYGVLRGYTDLDFARLPTLDLLREVESVLGRRISLGHLAEKTLGAAKSADGLQSLAWFRDGRLDLVEQYCRKDVDLVRRLYDHGAEKGHVLFERDGEILRIPAEWKLERVLKRRSSE